MRGPHPRDVQLHRPEITAVLRQAAVDLRYLLARGYGQRSAVKLVGDHFALPQRARQALQRAVTDPHVAQARRACRVPWTALAGAPLLVDGYNVLILLETALAGGLLVEGDDGSVRDAREAHGTYRSNAQSEPALKVLQEALLHSGANPITVYLDAPMPFSGVLATALRERWRGLAEVRVAPSADAAICEALRQAPTAVVASSDGPLLARARRHTDIIHYLAQTRPICILQLGG